MSADGRSLRRLRDEDGGSHGANGGSNRLNSLAGSGCGQRSVAELEQQLTDVEERLRKYESAEAQAERHCTLGKNVRLNVGGVVFTTSTQTLTSVPGSMLAAMFSGRFSLKESEDGSYFIDRDGQHFRHILNYLRDRSIPVLGDDAVRVELFREAHFYGLDELAEAIATGETGVTEQLSRIVLSHSSMVDFSLAEPEQAQVTGYFSADGRLSWVRGYELVPSVACRVCAVHVYLTMHAGKTGRICVYDGSGRPLCTGSTFVGPGRMWFVSELNPPLTLEPRQSYILFCAVDDCSYHCVSHGGNPQTGRNVDIFTVYGRSCPTPVITSGGGSVKVDSNKFNLLMKVVKL